MGPREAVVATISREAQVAYRCDERHIDLCDLVSFMAQVSNEHSLIALRANTTFTDEISKRNHEKTQSLLGDVLRSPTVDAEFRAMVQEMHAILVKPSLKAENVQLAALQDTSSPHDQFDIAPYSLTGSSIGDSSTPLKKHGRGLPSMRMYATSALPYRTPMATVYTRASSGETSTHRAMGIQSSRRQRRMENEVPNSYPTSDRELPAATVALNNKRRAFGAREYEAFKQRHAQPKRILKPSFLSNIVPSNQDLQACIPHIFQSTAEGKQQTQELKNEITRWTHEFSRFVNDGSVTQRVNDECLLTLLGVLNEAVDSSTGKRRTLFYETSDSAGFISVLNQMETISSSVRVKKEIEEFQDTKKEWSK